MSSGNGVRYLICIIHICVDFVTRRMNESKLDNDDDIYLTAIWLTPGGSITRNIYNKQYTQYMESTILGLRAVPVFASCTLTFASQLREKQGKNLS